MSGARPAFLTRGCPAAELTANFTPNWPQCLPMLPAPGQFSATFER